MLPYFLGATQWLMKRVPQAEIQNVMESVRGR